MGNAVSYCFIHWWIEEIHDRLQMMVTSGVGKRNLIWLELKDAALDYIKVSCVTDIYITTQQMYCVECQGNHIKTNLYFIGNEFNLYNFFSLELW